MCMYMYIYLPLSSPISTIRYVAEAMGMGISSRFSLGQFIFLVNRSNSSFSSPFLSLFL